MPLTKFHTAFQDVNLLQSSWASELDPVIAQPITKAVTLTKVSLVAGVNHINHKLQRNLQGWLIVRKRSTADVWDSQDSNSQPQLTLTLNASASVIVDLMVY